MVENSTLESLWTSLKEEITSEMKKLPAESQRELLQLLKTKTGECKTEEEETSLESEKGSFYTPIKSVRINSTQNNDPTISRNTGYIVSCRLSIVTKGRKSDSTQTSQVKSFSCHI